MELRTRRVRGRNPAWRRGERQCQEEGSPLAECAVHQERAAVSRSNLVGYGQSQPGATLTVWAGAVAAHPVEALEEAGPMLGGNAGSGIADGDRNLCARPPSLHRHSASDRGELDSVVQQVEEQPD